MAPSGSGTVVGRSDFVSMSVTTARTSASLLAIRGRWFPTTTFAPSGVTAAATGSRVTGTRATSPPKARSITETLLSKRLHT